MTQPLDAPTGGGDRFASLSDMHDAHDLLLSKIDPDTLLPDDVERIREFWETVSSFPFDAPAYGAPAHAAGGRNIVNETNATIAMLFGVSGFFSPRVPEKRRALKDSRLGRMTIL